MKQLGHRAAGTAGEHRSESRVMHHAGEKLDAIWSHPLHEQALDPVAVLGEAGEHLLGGAADGGAAGDA